MNNFYTEDQAANLRCPIARVFPDGKTKHCDGSDCILWRWKPRMATDPEFQAAIKREIALLASEHKETTGKDRAAHLFHNEAVKRVMRNPEGYGINREEGYCGLGGLPT